MNNDSIFQEQAALIAAIGDAGVTMQQAIANGLAEAAARELGKVLAKVDALRATIPSPAYEPAKGDIVWVMATVADIDQYGVARMKTGKGSHDCVYVNTNETPVKLERLAADVL